MLKKLFGDPNARKLKKFQPLIAEINLLEDDIKVLSDEELAGKTEEFKKKLATAQNDEETEDILDEILPEAFAVVREAGIRVLGMRHYDVQLLGGIVLHKGQIAEMKTGEGKTLVSTLPAYLNGLTGKGVHIVTVNDYLARRDAEWMGQVHRFLGLSVGLIQSTMNPAQKKKNYACDITYTTNSELGFDYLRDNMATTIEDVVQRPFNYCVIDEVDSILIDEARTPLIISGQVERPTQKYIQASQIAQDLIIETEENEGEGHYEVDEKARQVLMTDEGFAKAEELLGVKDLYDPENPWAHYVFNAIKAKELFTKDRNYMVRNGEIVIVDEFTGRVLAGRRWSDGLHQAIEAKEGVDIQNETQTLATITYQNFFLLYPKLSGMTGTAKTEETEFEKVYNLQVTIIPTNLPSRRGDLADVVYKTELGKWKSVAQDCEDMHKKGRPILVGTTTVDKSEIISNLLSEKGIKHNLLNARPENVERESEIVAQAGRKGAVTIATNMAGRGTDIILGGNGDFMARLKVREYFMPKIVIPEDSKNPVAAGAGSGGLKGGQGFGGNEEKPKKKTWKASEDIFPTELSNDIKAKLREVVDFAVEKYGFQSLTELEAEEKIAIAAEKAPTDDPVIQELRKVCKLVRDTYESFTKKEHQEVIETGGLHVIGTERHDSRRIDNQLRGRAGRQGDPGSTRFFLSLEDNLLRIFGGDRLKGMMELFRVEEDMPIESKMLTRSLEGAQKKVETFYYDTRKQVFEYDEVMNNQRRAIYAERRRVLEGFDLKEQVVQYAEKTIEEIVDAYVNPDLPPEEWDIESLVNKAIEFIYLMEDVTPKDIEDMMVGEIKTFLKEEVRKAYDLKENQVEKLQPSLMRQAERFFILQQIDNLWREHLQGMDALRDSIGLRGYGQKDPLIEYKQEGYEMFLEMMIDIRRNVVYSLFQFQPQAQPQPQAV